MVKDKSKKMKRKNWSIAAKNLYKFTYAGQAAYLERRRPQNGGPSILRAEVYVPAALGNGRKVKEFTNDKFHKAQEWIEDLIQDKRTFKI